MSLVTYLSDYVHRVIVQFSGIYDSCTRIFVTEDLSYNWSEIESLLGEITDDVEILNQSEEWYLEKSQLVWSVLHEAGSAVSTASNEERRTLYQLCDWVDCQTDVIEYALNCQNKEDGPLLAVLVLTAALERALGNVYLTKNHPVPFLLRDLLKTPELTCIFGKVPIVFTQLLVGCPRGFNLRNVAWHGFLSPGELHPHLVIGLTVLIASLGKILHDCQIIPKKRLQFSSFESFQDELNDVFPDLTSRSDEVQDMIEKSPFIPENGKIFWKKAYDLMQSERFGYSLVLIFPQLEHCLRVLYCRVNDCPARLLTAESTAFYTTLDEILAPSESAVVSSGLLMLLLDVTSSLSGPRVRDRLSHGEIQLSSVPHWLSSFVFCLALATAHSDHGDCKDSGKHCDIPLCSLLQEATSRYHSKFHVVASLRRQLASLVDQWPCWYNCPRPTDVVQPASCQLICALDQLMFPGGGGVIEKLFRVKECLGESELPTLFRPKPELELATALGVVLSRVTRTAEKVCHAAVSRYQLWCDRTLRSRARATAVRMWSVLPDVWTALLCTVAVVTLCYSQLPQLATQGKCLFRFVKALTKAVENTVTLCDVDKNRWMEAHQILSDLAATCLQFFTDNADLVNKIK